MAPTCFNSSKENTAVPTDQEKTWVKILGQFQLLKGKHGRSDEVINMTLPGPPEFQLLKGKHGRSDKTWVKILASAFGFNSSKENTAVPTK